MVAGAAQGCVCGAVPPAALLPAAAGDAEAHFGCPMALLLGGPPLIEMIIEPPGDDDDAGDAAGEL